MIKKDSYNDWNQMFQYFLEHGRYTFTYEEVGNRFELPDNALSHGLILNRFTYFNLLILKIMLILFNFYT
jgi:hypothetical protein